MEELYAADSRNAYYHRKRQTARYANKVNKAPGYLLMAINLSNTMEDLLNCPNR